MRAAIAIATVMAIVPACGPRQVMRVTGDRSPPPGESTGSGAPPASSRRGSSTAPADPSVDQVGADGIVRDPEDGERTDDVDRGGDYPD